MYFFDAMEEKKDFNLLASKLVALVDFIKWTSSFPVGVIQQMEVPLTGIRVSPMATHLFGLARDEIGWMLAMHEREGEWLANLPVESAYIGFDDSLIIVTEPVTMFDEPFPAVGVKVFIPQIALRSELAKHALLGFGILREATGDVERVNRLVPLYNPASYEQAKIAPTGTEVTALFSQRG